MAVKSKSSAPPGIGRISTFTSFFLTFTLCAFASALFIGQIRSIVTHMASATAPVFTTFRDPNTGTFFALPRIEDNFWLYGMAHTFPAMAWTLLIPVQLSDKIRRKYPRLHRTSGYTVFACSLLIAASGPLLAPNGLSFTHPNFWHFHSAGSKGTLIPSWIRWPSFEFATTSIEIAFVLTGVQALRKALARNYSAHRTWATRFSVAGYTIAIQRINMIIATAIGFALTLIPPESKLARDLGMPTGAKEMAEAERAAFSLTAVSAGFMGLAWGYHLENRRAAPRAKVL